MRIIAIIVVALPLSACGLGDANKIAQISPTDVKVVDDRQLCRGAPAADSQAVRDERAARDLTIAVRRLNTVTPRCYLSGTDPYSQCRQTQAAKEAPTGYTIDEARPAH